MTEIIIASALPVLILLFYIYFRDKYEREPIGMIIGMSIAGMICTGVILTFHRFVDLSVFYTSISDPFWRGVIRAFVNAAIPEELCKFAFIYFLVWNNINYQDRVDGIIYAVCVGMGFAFIENIVYFISAGNISKIFLTRILYPVPAHFLFAVIMGYYLSLAKFIPKKRIRFMAMAIVYPIVAHGIYDSLLMAQINMSSDGRDAMAALLSVAFIVFIFILWKIGLRNIKRHAETSVFKHKAKTVTPKQEESA